MLQRKIAIAAALTLAVLAAGCTTTVSTTTAGTPTDAAGLGALTAEERRDLRIGYDDAIRRLDETTPGARELIAKAAGVLVFPSTLSGGLFVGGELGNGLLRVNNNFAGHYRIAAGSLGLQVGAQSRSLVFLFMTEEALAKFRGSAGWSVGADASLAVMKVGANGAIDINVAQTPTLAFVMTNAGLMANLTFKGTRITPIE